jgi:hypothetical protein
VKKLRTRSLSSANKLSTKQTVLFGTAFAVVGAVILIATHAAGFSTSFEAENSSKNSPASTVADASASGGSALKFSPASAVSSSCPLPAYPNASCTGVPAGTTFTNTVSGTYTVSTPGQVIDKWHITGDLHILANNTVIKNSQIDGTVNNQGTGETYYSFTITDSTVGPPAACTKDSPPSCQSGSNSTGCIVSPGIGESNFTATRVYVRGHDDGFRLSGSGNGTVQDSYEYACYLNATFSPPDGSHSDGVQAVCAGNPCPGLTLIHNTLDLSGVPATFTLNLTDSALSNVTVNDNMLLGGNNYIIDAWWHSGANWIFHNNRLVQGTWGSDTRLIAAVTGENTCTHQDWQGNTVVTIDTNYNITSTVQPIPCQE